MLVSWQNPISSIFFSTFMATSRAGHGVFGKVLLRGVAGDDHLGSESDPGKEHLHLRGRSVLGLVQNDKRVVQGPTSHVGERRHLDKAFLHVFRKAVSAHDLIESVIERPQIGVYLALKVAGKKSQLLSRLDRRPCENDPADFFIAESGHRHSHREVRLTGFPRGLRRTRSFSFGSAPHTPSAPASWA